MRGRHLDVIHSGKVLLSDGVGRGKPARLVLTKDQLTIQLHALDNDDDALSTCAITQAESNFDSTLRTVNVNKSNEGIGLSIKGGSDGTHSVPIVISKVLPNLPAAQTGQIFVGDSIVEINGISVEGKTHEEVVQMLKQSTDSHVTLTLRHDSKLAPLLRPASSKQSVADSIVDINVYFKSALKTPTNERQHRLSIAKEEDFNSEMWKTMGIISLPMAIVSRYLWGTDKIRNNSFEVRSVDGKSSGVIHCEDRKALEQWIKHIETHIFALNKKSIRMSNKYLHPSEKISYIGWVEERLQNCPDPKLRWQQRFLIFKGSDVCVFESPPLNAEELDKCLLYNYKVYETALKTAIKPVDRRDNIFLLDTAAGAQHYFSLQSRTNLQQFETAYYNCVYKAVTAIQTRTFACSFDGRPAGLVLDINQGILLYDIPTKRYLWQYKLSELENSSDDGKMRIQFIFRDDSNQSTVNFSSEPMVYRSSLDTKDVECDQLQSVVFTLHAFYITKIMGADPEFLKSLPLS
ncbi:PDZ domain (Also known as DHR or GLGF) domain-containing protein [Ditylenchus destructor]|nr:PDZ domain (Also known as DHR or GLGF) domain-containing protein [Ditylenchus destructor]